MLTLDSLCLRAQDSDLLLLYNLSSLIFSSFTIMSQNEGEVFLELFPIHFWIPPFKIGIPTVEIYHRNRTRVPSSRVSHFVLIPTCVGPKASTYS